MKNPFKMFKKIIPAAKVGYKVLQRYQELEALGLVPVLKVKDIPVAAIDNAAEAFVRSIKREKDSE